MLNKDGFSLIEFIICFAIMAIISVSGFSLSSHIKYANVEKCAKEIDQQLEKAKMVSISKSGDWNLFIFKKDSGLYYQLTDKSKDFSKGEKVGGSGISLYATKKGGTEAEIKGTDYIQIAFSKNSGVFISTPGGASVYSSIRISGGSSKGYTISLVELTGKHSID